MSFLSKLINGDKGDSGQQKTESSKPSPVEQSVTTQSEEKAEQEASIGLGSNDILLSQKAGDKSVALKIIADQMLASGYVSADYTQAMLERDEKVSTYLINGVAICWTR
ncbi:MAG: PTS sugar transporter subunit IIA [Candidatus Sedimenticola sp. 4PFRAG1]